MEVIMASPAGLRHRHRDAGEGGEDEPLASAKLPHVCCARAMPGHACVRMDVQRVCVCVCVRSTLTMQIPVLYTMRCK